MELHLRQFDMSTIQDDKVVVCIGRRGSGKSWAVRELLSHHTSIPTGIVVSPTEQANHFFSEMIPSLLIHHEYTPAVVANLVNRQTAIIRKRDAEARLGGGDIDPRAFAILDDCNYDSSWIKDKNIRYLFMNGRHIKVLFLITMQYSLGLPPNLRSNVDYTFLFREPNINNRKRLYENYAGMVPTFEAFCQILDQCTQDHDFLVIDNTCCTSNLTDQLFWCRANTPEPFRMCTPKLWELSDQIVSQKAEEDGRGAPELYDIEAFRKVKHKLKVIKG
jgi:hypothetical protein